jgi:hypothetical protein
MIISCGSCCPNFCVSLKNWTDIENGKIIWLSDSFAVRESLLSCYLLCDFLVLSSVEDSYFTSRRAFWISVNYFVLLGFTFYFILLRGDDVENQAYNLTNTASLVWYLDLFLFCFGKKYCGNKCFCQVSAI